MGVASRNTLIATRTHTGRNQFSFMFDKYLAVARSHFILCHDYLGVPVFTTFRGSVVYPGVVPFPAEIEASQPARLSLSI